MNSPILIDYQIFRWLQSLTLLSNEQGKRSAQNQIILNQKLNNQLIDGLFLCKIIKKILQNRSMNQQIQNILKKLNSIKQNSTPAIRLYNWNIITDILKYFHYNLDYGQKSKILNLQYQPIIKIIQHLKAQQNKQTLSNSPNQSNLSNNNHSLLSNSNISQLGQNSNISVNDSNILTVNIPSIVNKQILQSNNIMQFFVISLSKNFKLSPSHTLNLFLDQNKYLAHLLVKGIKDSFEPILNFQYDILRFLDYIILNLFLVDQEKSLEFLFNGVKACLISKNINVAMKCLEIFQKVHSIYHQNKLNTQILNKWIAKEGINTLLFSSKRHEDLLQSALKISYLYIQDQLFQFIRPNQKSILWNDDNQKLNFYYMFLRLASQKILQNYSKMTCLIQWNQYLLKSMKKLKNVKEILLIVKILNIKWMNFTEQFQKETNSSSLAQNFVSFLKNNSFSSNFMLFIQTIKSMFDLMQFLGKRKNNYAPIFYKTLINCLSFQSNQQRVNFIVQNFTSVFRFIENLPGNLIVEPLLKSIQRNPTLPSLNLCKQLILNQKIKQEDSIQIIQMYTKVFFQDINNGPIAIQYIFECFSFISSEQIQYDFCINNSQLCLSHFYSISKSIKRSFQQIQNNFKKYQNQKAMKQGQQGFLTQVKKYLIIQNLMKFIQHVIVKQDQQIKDQLEQQIFMTYLKVKNQLQKPDIAQILLINILKKYYDIEEQLIAAIDKYEKKYFNFLKVQQARKKNLSISLDSDEQQIKHQNGFFQKSKPSPKQQRRMFASQSMILEDSAPSMLTNSRQKILRPQKSALKDLELIKKKLQSKRITTEQHLKKRDLIDEKKNLLKNVLNEKRFVRFGTKYQQNLQYKCLFDFDTVKTDKDIINGFPNFQLINLQQQQEDQYVNDVNSIIKKYRKVWRFLFFKYSTFGAKVKNQIRSEQKINISEVWKMHKQYKIDSMMKKQQTFFIIKVINENMKRKNDLQNLTYLGFQQYIVQFSILALNRIGLSNLSPGQKLLNLLKRFKQITLQKGGNIQIFQNPEQIYFQQTDVIKQFNKRLADNPNYILPEGYKKINQSQFIYQNQFSQQSRKCFEHKKPKFVHNQSYFDVLQVLDMILFENQKLNFHIIEPKTKKVEKIIAKPALFQQINQKMKNYKNGYMMPKRQINSTYIQSRDKILKKNQFHPLVQFSLGIKMGIAEVNIKNKYIAQQVAYLMDDILDAVQQGNDRVINKAKRKIQNDALKKKKMLLYKIKNDMKQKQKIYKQRSQSVKMQFEKIQNIRVEQKKKKINQIKKKQLQQKQRQQKQMTKRLKQFQKAKQYFTQKHLTQKQKIQKQKQQAKKQKQQYKKNVEEYFKKKKQQLQEKQYNMKKDKQFQQKKIKEEQEKKKNLQKKVYLSVLKKDQQALSKIQSIKQKYTQFRNKKFIQQEFDLHRKSLKMLFDLLLKHEKSKISTTVQNNEISQNTFNFFTVKFKIVPFMLQKNSIVKIFKSIGKQIDYKSSPGLSYRGFQQALLKIIIKAKNLLNELIQNKKKYFKMNKSRIQNKMKQSLLMNSQPNDQPLQSMNQNNVYDLQSSKLTKNVSRVAINQSLSQQYLFDPQNVTQQTIRQFLLFLNLPDDKISLQKRYRELIQNKNSQPAKLIKKQLIQEIIKN